LEEFKGEWGLTTCAPAKHCGVCEEYGEKLYQLRHMRDLYCGGLDAFALSKVFKLPKREISQHIYEKRWDRKRQFDPRDIAEMQTFKLLEARAEETWDEHTPDSADRALNLMVKMTGTQKVAVKNDVVFSWDEHVISAEQEDDGTYEAIVEEPKLPKKE